MNSSAASLLSTMLRHSWSKAPLWARLADVAKEDPCPYPLFPLSQHHTDDPWAVRIIRCPKQHQLLKNQTDESTPSAVQSVGSTDRACPNGKHCVARLLIPIWFTHHTATPTGSELKSIFPAFRRRSPLKGPPSFPGSILPLRPSLGHPLGRPSGFQGHPPAIPAASAPANAGG